MKLVIIGLFALLTLMSCNDKKGSMAIATDANDIESKYEKLSDKECVNFFFKLRNFNRRPGIVISTNDQPRTYNFIWDKSDLDKEIDSEISNINSIGSEVTFIQVTGPKHPRYPLAQKLVGLAKDTKLYSTCIDYLKSVRSECSAKDKNRLTGACFQSRFSWYRYYVSDYIVNKSNNGVADMSQLQPPTSEEIAEISKHPMILSY